MGESSRDRHLVPGESPLSERSRLLFRWLGAVKCAGLYHLSRVSYYGTLTGEALPASWNAFKYGSIGVEPFNPPEGLRTGVGNYLRSLVKHQRDAPEALNPLKARWGLTGANCVEVGLSDGGSAGFVRRLCQSQQEWGDAFDHKDTISAATMQGSASNGLLWDAVIEDGYPRIANADGCEGRECAHHALHPLGLYRVICPEREGKTRGLILFRAYDMLVWKLIQPVLTCLLQRKHPGCLLWRRLSPGRSGPNMR